MEKYLAEQRGRIARKLLSSDRGLGRILDVGCGSYPFFLLSIASSEKYGVDKVIDEETTSRFQRYGIVLKDHEIESGAMPFDGDFFDAVTMLAVVEHIAPERLAEVLSEIHRILRPSGTLVITTPASWTGSMLRIMARANLVSAVEIGDHKACYATSTICAVLEEAGFSRENMRHGYFELLANTWVAVRK